jgi:hypothetical protein
MSEQAEQGMTEEELFRFWTLEKLSQMYDLLAVVAAEANASRARDITSLHKQGKVMFAPGWRPSDDQQQPVAAP